ncbi:MAG TPA: cytochrome c, partial [Verrucomicrobiae bacterium]|nr:cytochrome c [Verrucomicrobiae bacterium]
REESSMKTRFFRAAATLLVWTALSAAPLKITLPAETAKFKESSGSELATGHCLLCHSADYISTQPRLPRATWRAIVVKMREKYGAPIAETQIDPIANYLARNYGKDGK